jgi:hypothetical protein
MRKWIELTVILKRTKGKGHPITGHEGPEVVWGYSSTLSLTSTLDGVGGQCHVPAALPPEKPGTHCTGGWVSPRDSTRDRPALSES